MSQHTTQKQAPKCSLFSYTDVVKNAKSRVMSSLIKMPPFIFHVVQGGRNLGKKISVPKDVMIEELTVPSNRGSRMFQERQKRSEMFTLEKSGVQYTNNVRI